MNQYIAFKTLVKREVVRVFRIWSQTLLPPIITSFLYFIIFGHVIGSRIGDIDGMSYMEFILPGLVFMPMVMAAYTNSSSSFFGAKLGRSIEELLVSPMSNVTIILGYVTGAVLRGVLIAILVSTVGWFFTRTPIHSYFIVLLYAVIGSLLFGLAGLLNGIYAKTFDDISFLPTFVLTPLNYFGGVFYSVQMLPGIWQHVAQIDPILYLMQGFRYGFLGIYGQHIYMTTFIAI